MTNHVRGRKSLIWLTVPFLFFWALLAVIVSPLAIWLAARKDPYYLRDEAERTDVD